MTKSNKVTIDRLFQQMWNNRDLNVADELFNLPTCIHLPTGEQLNLEEFKLIVQQFYKAFPDIIHGIDDYLEEKNKCAVRWHGVGTHQGQIGDFPATGKQFHYAGITIFYFNEEHRITKVWLFNNFTDMLNVL